MTTAQDFRVQVRTTGITVVGSLKDQWTAGKVGGKR